MNLPIDIEQKINELLDGYKLTDLAKISASISERYLSLDKNTNKDICNNLESLVYCKTRMPATYSSAYKVLKELSIIDNSISSIFDIGLGTGSGYFASNELFPNISYSGIEKNTYMLDSFNILKNDSSSLYIINKDIREASIENKYDLVMCLYSLNEFKTDLTIFNSVLDKIYYMSNKYILIVEPGTMDAFNKIKYIRDYFIKKGMNCLAPCPHNLECKNQWCHFSTRVQRDRLSKYLKGGDAPYEDEKYTYLILSKNDNTSGRYERIIRHPIINKGYIEIESCKSDGIISTYKVTKKDNRYKQIKKTSWGDKI